MLTAVARRLKQLDKDASEAERVRILAFKQIGELLGPAEFGRNNPNGSNQYAKVDKSPHRNLSTSKPSIEKKRDYQARTIKDHWVAVEPLVEEMKKPSVNAVMREIKRLTSKLSNTPDGVNQHNKEVKLPGSNLTSRDQSET